MIDHTGLNHAAGAQELQIRWPATPFHIVLVEPEIPPNTGNIARLCAATCSVLHLVRPLGFRLNDKTMKRAGLDYWNWIEMHVHDNFDGFLRAFSPSRVFLFSVGGSQSCLDIKYKEGDALVFGSESAGLPDELKRRYAGNVFAIPMRNKNVRSLNLANCVSIALYEALRQVASS